MKLEASDARWSTDFAISSGVAMRFRACSPSTKLSRSGVASGALVILAGVSVPLTPHSFGVAGILAHAYSRGTPILAVNVPPNSCLPFRPRRDGSMLTVDPIPYTIFFAGAGVLAWLLTVLPLPGLPGDQEVIMRISLSLILLALACPPVVGMAAEPERPAAVLVAPEFPLSLDELQARGLFAFPADTQTATPIEQLYEVVFVFENFRYRLTARYRDTESWQVTAFRASGIRTEDTPPIKAVPRDRLFPDAGPTMSPRGTPTPTRGENQPPPSPPAPPRPGVIPASGYPGDFIGQTRRAGTTGWQSWWNVSTTYMWRESAGGARSWYLTSFDATRCDGYQDC